MTSILDVATYIMEETNNLSPMKLQKLCYYSQAWSLTWNDVPLFDENFCAWANGPVCEVLFANTRDGFLADSKVKFGNSNNLSEEQKNVIDTILKKYGNKDAQWLNRLTQLENPWKNTAKNSIITKENIKNYYKTL